MPVTRRKTAAALAATMSEEPPHQAVCTMCSENIEEASGECAGQEALFCEGACQRWLHRWCAGVSSEQFERLVESSEPFFCSVCSYQEQQKTIRELQGNVRALNAELLSLKATVATLLQKNNPPTANAVPTATGGGPGVQDTSTGNGKLTSGWNVVAGRNKRDKNKHPVNDKAEKARQGSGQSSSSDPCNRQPAKGPKPPLVEVSGCRKVWGTIKSTTNAAVEKALTNIAKIPENALTVKRKYKVARDGSKRVVRWWFVIRGSEEILQQLQTNWGPIAIQTAWKLEPVFMFDHEKTQGASRVPTGSGSNSPLAQVVFESAAPCQPAVQQGQIQADPETNLPSGATNPPTSPQNTQPNSQSASTLPSQSN